MKNKPVLGRGLDALIRPSNTESEMRQVPQMPVYQERVPEKQPVSEQSTINKLPIHLIEPNPYQPRRVFDPAALLELKNSIIQNGLIQPITVRKISENKYQLVSGERRLRASIEIGVNEITAYILENVTDEAMLAMALIENIQREQLNPIEIAYAYKRLIDECDLTQDQVADRVGKDRTTVANSIRLLKLPQEIQDSLAKGELSMGHARPLININNPSLQIQLFRKIISENLSVRKVEQLVKDALLDVKQGGHKPIKVSSVTPLNAGMQTFEDSLRRILGTKVICNQKKDGKGEIIIEYYSNDEFERVFELLYGINQNG